MDKRKAAEAVKRAKERLELVTQLRTAQKELASANDRISNTDDELNDVRRESDIRLKKAVNEVLYWRRLAILRKMAGDAYIQTANINGSIVQLERGKSEIIDHADRNEVEFVKKTLGVQLVPQNTNTAQEHTVECVPADHKLED